MAQLDFKPHQEYIDYLFSTESTYDFDGAYLIEADELLQFNSNYEAVNYYPGYFLIGSDGGGEALAIEKDTGNFVALPFIGHDEEAAIVIGRTWDEFLQRLLTIYSMTSNALPRPTSPGLFRTFV